MAAPNDGTTALPSDASSRYHLGLWDGSVYRAWKGDANGSGKVLLVDANGNALIKAEDAAHASGDPGIQALAVRKDTAAALAGADGDYIPLIVDANGRLHVALSDLALVDDAAFTAATSRVVPIGGVYQATADEVNDGDVGAPRMNARRVMMASAPDYDWGFVNGYGASQIYGNTADWKAIRNATDSAPSDALDSAANVLKYFDSDDAAFDGTTIWIWIPIMAAGWRNFHVYIGNLLGVNLTISAYGLPTNTRSSMIGNSQYFTTVLLSGQVVAHGGTLAFGNGGTTISNQSQWPVGYLVVKAVPASDPGAGTYWTIGCARST